MTRRRKIRKARKMERKIKRTKRKMGNKNKYSSDDLVIEKISHFNSKNTI